jgi:hypothetical protein
MMHIVKPAALGAQRASAFVNFLQPDGAEDNPSQALQQAPPPLEGEELGMAHAVAEHGAIYLIGDGGPLVKLGWAFDPLSRLKRLQTGHPSTLTLLAFYPGDRSLEAALLVMIAPHYVAQGVTSAWDAIDCANIESEYARESAHACKKLTAGLTFPEQVLPWMATALKRHEGEVPR